ncbi:MAG: FAD/FMN-dependent dehydrogenase [Acidimicrobiales bacterium]|nr:FAD/FMN-dependent dehydrogenase [Acidimicrobiales bacterium]
MDTNRGAPTPAIAFDAPPSSIARRFDTKVVDLDDTLLDRLRATGAVVVTELEETVETGRDWWPLAMAWALDGTEPGRASVVVRPSSVDQVAGVLATCNESRVPVTAAAGRSGVCGASVPLHGGVLLDLTGLVGVVDVDDTSLLVRVRAGTFGDVFEDELRSAHGLSVGHWPQSVQLSTVGGWVACRGAGQYSTRYGKIEDMVAGLEVVLADGRVIRTGGAPRAAVGPDLNQVFVGNEGTLGVITEATLRAHPLPPAERRAAFGFGSFLEGLDACRRVLRRGATPAVLRLYDEAESQRNFDVGDQCVLIVLDEGEPALIDGVLSVVAEECAGAGPLDSALVERWLDHRNDVSALEALIRREIVVDTIEIAATWAALGPIYDEVRSAVSAVEHTMVVSAHQSHAYADGACLYFTFAGRPPREERDRFYVAAWDAATDAVLAHGGALSHHHGVGLNRARFVRTALGPAFDVLASMKTALDPNGILNPGKLGLPDPFGEVAWP